MIKMFSKLKLTQHSRVSSHVPLKKFALDRERGRERETRLFVKHVRNKERKKERGKRRGSEKRKVSFF